MYWFMDPGRGHTDGVVLTTEDEAAFAVDGGLVEVRVDVVLVVACRVHHVQRHVCGRERTEGTQHPENQRMS